MLTTGSELNLDRGTDIRAVLTAAQERKENFMKNTRNFATALALALVGVGTAQAAMVVGLSTRNQLVTFDSATPQMLMSARFVSGLSTNEALVGIDYRPATGQLYGLGSFGRLYTLNAMTGAASLVATLTDSVTGSNIMLDGVEFGFDFNPTVDRIRVTSDRDMNLRINPITGVTIVDGMLSNSGGGNPHIVGSAYTNNDMDPSTGTTLYNIDSASDMLTIQNPANAGTNTNVGMLGMDVSSLVGFDILTSGNTNTAWAALQSANGDSSSFFSVNLMTGAATMVGSIGMSQSSDSLAIRDIAVNPVPEPATMIALGAGALALLRRRAR